MFPGVVGSCMFMGTCWREPAARWEDSFLRNPFYFSVKLGKYKQEPTKQGILQVAPGQQEWAKRDKHFKQQNGRTAGSIWNQFNPACLASTLGFAKILSDFWTCCKNSSSGSLSFQFSSHRVFSPGLGTFICKAGDQDHKQLGPSCESFTLAGV